MTYEQLQEVSGIHRNSLRKRLDELTKERVLIKHKYQIPKNDLYYGTTSQYSVLPDCRYHYLLNVWKDETKELLDMHYFLDQLDDATTTEIKAMIDRLKQLQRPIDAPSIIHKLILDFNRIRETELAILPVHHRFHNLQTNFFSDSSMKYDTFLKNLMEFADHLIRFKYSILDLIIRCCNAIIISTKNFNPHNEFAKFLLFPMVTYREMLSLVRSTKYATQLFQLFDVSIKY